MNRLPHLCNNGLTATTLIKGDERYILLFDARHRSEALRQLGRWAANRKLSFNWYDAAKMSQSVREGMKP